MVESKPQILFMQLLVKREPFVFPPVTSIIIAILSVQGGAAIAKSMFPILGASATALVRIGISTIILLLVFRPRFKKIKEAQWRTVIPYGVCLGAMNILFYLSINKIPLGLAVTLEFAGPLILAVLGSKRLLDYIWVGLAALGIAFIAPWDGNGINVIGTLLALLAGIFWAGYIVVGGKVSKLMTGGEAVSIGMLFATFTVLPFSIASGGLSHFSTGLLFSGIALAVLSSALPFTLEMNALKKMPTNTFSVMMSLEPAVASLCGIVFLHEILTIWQWLAVIMVVSASIGATLSGQASH